MKMPRGQNPEFIRGAVLMILEKNYQVQISDPQEIDTSLSIGENISILLDKYKNTSILDVLDEL